MALLHHNCTVPHDCWEVFGYFGLPFNHICHCANSCVILDLMTGFLWYLLISTQAMCSSKKDKWNPVRYLWTFAIMIPYMFMLGYWRK